MMKKTILVSIFIGIAATVSADYVQCCDSGSFVRVNATTANYICLNVDTNATSELSLRCGDDAVINITNTCLKHDIDKLNCFGHDLLNGTYCVGTRRVRIRNKPALQDTTAYCNYKPHEPVVSRDVKSWLKIISVIFLLLTCVIYGSLPELRDLEGWSYVNLCGSLAIAYSILIIMNLVPYKQEQMNQCAARGFLAYFFLVAAFFWMNAISIQIMNSIRQTIIRPFMKRQLLCYMLYAWGSAALLTSIMAVVNYVEGDHTRPGIGLNHCWFTDNKQVWIYLYSVMVILLFVNVCIFVYITLHLWNHRFSSSNITALKYKFCLSFRLFIVMGIPWIFEMINAETTTTIITHITNIVNMLVGVFYFLILVIFRRRAIKALHRHRWLCCCDQWVERYIAKAEDAEDQNIEHTQVQTMDSVMQ